MSDLHIALGVPIAATLILLWLAGIFVAWAITRRGP